MNEIAPVLSFSDYCKKISNAFDNLSYSEIQFNSDEKARLLIPSLNDGSLLSPDVSESVGNLFREYKDYGCNIESRVISSWSHRISEEIPFDDEEFQSHYSQRTNAIDTIKKSRGLTQSNAPYWGVLVFSHGIPILFHCQVEIGNKPINTKELCLSLCHEYDNTTSYNRYPLPNSEISIQLGKVDFDWLYFHSLWWNSEDNAFIRYSRNIICKWNEHEVREELKRMQNFYVEKAVREYNLNQEMISSLNPGTELGVINEVIAGYDWATHTLMLMESHRQQFLKERKAKERIPTEEAYYRTVQNYCRNFRLDYDGKAKPRFKGHGWTSDTLRELFEYLVYSKNISSQTAYHAFCYYFGEEAYLNMEEPESRIEWIGNNKGLFVAFVEEFKDEIMIERSGTKKMEANKKNKDSQVQWQKLSQVLVISGDSTIQIDGKKKPNVKRKNLKQLNPYERYQIVLYRIKRGTPFKYLDVCKDKGEESEN